MSTGLQYLDVGIGIAVFAAILWWMFSLSTRSRTERKQAVSSKSLARQPWDNEKIGRGGNR